VQVKGQFSLGTENASYFRCRTVFTFLRRLAVETPWFTHSQEISGTTTGQKDHGKGVLRF
jgi:hypothetical protein